MPPTFVFNEATVPARRAEGDTASEKTVIGQEQGCELLDVASGSGSLELEGKAHPLAPDTGAYLRAGERYVVENPGPEELLVVSVTIPGTNGARPQRRV